MRRIAQTLLAIVLWSIVGNNPVFADGMILPETLSPDYLVVRYHHVAVDINGGHAVTRVEQEFHNPHSFQVSGRYLFPVPPDAILSHFRAVVDGQPQSVTRQDPETTNATLYGIVVERRDPSLLQYADWETLTFDLELPAGGSRRMSLEYEEVLIPSGGLYRYRYVLSTERYSSLPLEQVSLTVNLSSSSGLSSLYSSTHSVSTERLGPGQARVTWASEQAQPTQDFELFFAPAEQGFGGGLLTGRRGDHDYFMFLFTPEKEALQGNILPKDIVFVIDRSGSMVGEKIQQARKALDFILGQLNENDRFSIVGFDHRTSVFSSVLQPAEERAVVNARRFVNQLDAEGDTDMEAALNTALGILSRSDPRDASRVVVFLTDGLPTAGITDQTVITRLVGETNTVIGARMHVFGVGYDVNTHLLDRLAEENGGTVTYVQPGESLEAVLTSFYEHIAQPVLTDIEIEFEGMETSALYPRALPDLFHGSSLLLAGRFQSTEPNVAVRVRGNSGNEEREYIHRYDLRKLSHHDFVPRLWATRRLGDLMDHVRVEGEKPALVDEIRELGLGFGLVTPYTTDIIDAQTAGAASAYNMALYANQAQLNQTWGQTTVQARVQNQLYQQAVQASLASGANIVNRGQRSLAQFERQFVDLALLQALPPEVFPGQKDSNGPITLEWLQQNITLDLTVAFGSDEYFRLAEDPAAREFLQNGPNVFFLYGDRVIAVQDFGPEDADPAAVPPAPERVFGWHYDVSVWLVRVIKAWLRW